MPERTAIAVAGTMVVDSIKRISSWPDQRELVSILNIERVPGGLVSNVGIDLARLDSSLPVMAIGCVGADENGELLRRAFARYPSIDTCCLWNEGTTSFTDVMTVDGTGERTFFVYKGSDGLLTPAHLRKVPLERCRLLHIGYLLLMDGMDAPDEEYGTCLARALAEAQARGVETSVDVVSRRGGPFREIVPPALKYVDDLVINEYEAEQITGVRLRPEDESLTENLQEALERLRGMGVKKRVVVHMPTLAAGLDETGFTVAPSLCLPDGFIKGSVGAGDAFTAGFLYEIVRGASMATALRTGNAVAACSLSESGSTDGVPSIEEALGIYSRFPLRGVK